MTTQSIDTRLAGTPRTRFLLELFGNSAQFPIVNILLEMLLDGPAAYVLTPDLFIILLGSIVQAYFLSRWQITAQPRRFLGNLIGPALYTVIESGVEGTQFFTTLHHWAYWGFAFMIGILQTSRPRLPRILNAVALILEDTIRASIMFVMYVIFETRANSTQTVSLDAFFADMSHQFIGLVTLLLGLSIGLSSLTAQRYLDLLRQTSRQLNMYSEWLLGRALLGRAMTDPSALTLNRRERTVLFMDIRNFTNWCESHTPEQVVAMLNRYYQIAETILTRQRVVKFKLSADEVMAVFSTADDAANAARELRPQVCQLLAEINLGAGIGLHTGPLVEGLLGSADVKFYDVIGDTVNIAKRIESATLASQVLVSENCQGAITQAMRWGAKQQISVKGKDAPLIVYLLED